MENKNLIFQIIILIISLVLLISYLIYNHIKSLNILNNSIKIIYENKDSSKTYLDLNDPIAMEKEYKKIRHYESIERNIIRHLEPNDEKESKLRALEESNIFTDEVSFITPYSDTFPWTYAWVKKGLGYYEDNTKFYVYPYSFSHKYNNSEGKEVTVTYPQGAYFSTDTDYYKTTYGTKTDRPINFYRTRSLSYSDVAILSIESLFAGINEDLFYDGVDWGVYLNVSIGLGYFENFDLYYEQKMNTPNKFYVSKINDIAIKNGKLMIGINPRFKALIVPDFKLGSDEIIKAKLGEKGIQEIIKFYNNGGIIIVTGKSGILFEDFDLIQKGTYDRSKLFSINSYDRKVGIIGCSELYGKPFNSEIDDFEKRMLCMSIFNYRRIGLSTTFKTINKDDSFTTLLELNSTDEKLILIDSKSGLTYPLTEEEKKFNPLISFKSNKKNGQLFILNYNPLFKGTDINPTFNILMLIFTKELFITSKVNVNTLTGEAIIPAGEPGLEVDVDSKFQNLFDKDINNIKIYLFFPDNINLNINLDTCIKKNDILNIPNNVKNKKLFESQNEYFLCEYEKIKAYETINLKSKISILNYVATQMKEKFEILEIIVTFIDYKNREIIMEDYQKVDAKSGSILRGTINLDLFGDYPVWGNGTYKDSSLKIENKGEGDAFDVEYYGVYSLLGPLVVSTDLKSISHKLKLYVDYYNKNNYSIPFYGDNEEDLIDTNFLNNKGVYLVVDWDAPVQISKVIYPEKIPENISIHNIGFSGVVINSTRESIRQINYKKSDMFFKLAFQRLIAFVDDTTPEGAKTLYGDNIPEEIKDPVLKDRTKIELIFLRQDLYFYNEKNYIYPEGINDKIIFSVDKLEKYQYKTTDCAKTYGEAKSKIKEKGYWTNREEDKKSTILKPHIWKNNLFELCELTVIDPTNEEEIINQFGNLDTYKPVHFLVHNNNENITQPQQIMDFIQVNENYGYHKDYPQIKFIYVHKLNFIMENIYCIYGGKIIINIGDYTIKNINQVTVSPNFIAVYNITYDNGVIAIYFKRGLMPNEQYEKNMNLTINIEELSSKKNETFKVRIEELKYDISYSPDYERYYFVYEKDELFEYISSFSFPALQIKTKLNRTLNGYETLEPYGRYGVYIQEIYHRSVYASGEVHFFYSPPGPGIAVNHAGTIDFVSHLGTDTIEHNRYLGGDVAYNPATESTSRIVWKDIWGRKWSQPIRSMYADYVIVPPGLKSFAMTTTFEILRDGKQIMEWPSDENVQIHLHIKLLNNYLKYWDITRCFENNIRYVPKHLLDNITYIYENETSYELKDEEIKGDNTFLKQANYAAYGICYKDKRTVLKGKNITDEELKKIEKATLCAESRDPEVLKKCIENLKDIPTVNKSPEDWDMSKLWNYSPLVENFYPEGYIDNTMWTMNSYEYEDNPCNKAYRGIMDNWLPNIDNAIKKTSNTIVVPIYKGLGYNITYDSNNKMNYHGINRTGWWCDNLQNKDDTLLAGQEKINQISVDKKEEIIWLDADDLVGSTRENSDQQVKDIMRIRKYSIYTCLFNRKRPQIKKDSKKVLQSINICQNNIIPILVDLENNDTRLVNYNCDKEQYTPENIYKEKGNILITPTDKDYLYFGANLRGGAKEALNILLNLNFFSKLKYEGIVKINEGSRLIYYAPGWGANTYMIYDDPVTIINSKRNDIQVDNIIMPLTTTTFNGVLYHIYTIKDINKINKEWPYKNYYQNSYGFGDVSVSVSVGGIKRSKPIVQPGGTTYAKIIFYNNCGFDWNMKNGSIDFIYKGDKHINAFDLMKNFTHTIQEPIKYNFLNYIIEDKYKEYITIKPSNHNIEIAPEFFDFGFINVVTIRDGFKGEYDLEINVTNEFPDYLRGKPIEIKIDLITSYFDHFPGTNTDPTNPNKYHNYKVKIPSIYIAVPFKGKPFEGKVLYTSAQSRFYMFQFYTYLDSVTEGKYINNTIKDKFLSTSTKEEPIKEMNELWNNLTNETSIEFNVEITEKFRVIKILSLMKDYPLFPEKRYGEPDKAEFSILFKTNFSQLEKGLTYPIGGIYLGYLDWINKYKDTGGKYYGVTAKGAWIELSYSRTLVDYISEDNYIEKEDQELSPAEEGIVKVQFKLENTGNGEAYNVIYQILIGENVTYFGHRKGINKISEKKTENGTLLSFDLNSPINPQELLGGIIYLKYNKIIDKEYLTTDAIKQLPSELNVAKQSSVILDLTENKGENSVTQILRKSLNISYTNYESSNVYIHLTVSGRRNNPTLEIEPIIKTRENTNLDNFNMSIRRFDLTKYKDIQNYNNMTTLCSNEKIKNIEDKPINIEKNNKDHIFKYIIYIYLNDGNIKGEILYEQSEIGISTAELTLIILSIIFYCFAFFITYLGYRNYKNSKKELIKEMNDSQLAELINEE